MIDWQQVKDRMQENEAELGHALVVAPIRLEEILRQRAVQLSARQTGAAPKARREAVLVFSLGEERYAIDSSSVAEVFVLAKCSPVAASMPELLGVINHRGEVRSVVDLARILDLPEQDRPEGFVILVRDGDLEVGFKVDQVESIQHIEAESLAAPGGDGGLLPVQYVRGLTPDRLIVLDTSRILSHPIFANEPL